MDDPVNHPKHYTSMACVIEPIEVTYAMHSALGQVLQYILRYKHKDNPIQDLKKAIFGLEWFKKRYYHPCYGMKEVRVMATDSTLDEALRRAFCHSFKSDDALVMSAVHHLLGNQTIIEIEVECLIEELKEAIDVMEVLS